MTVEAIKKAVSAGFPVYWVTNNYRVILDSIGQFLIHSQFNDHYIGLTHQDGVTLNGSEDQFFMAFRRVDYGFNGLGLNGGGTFYCSPDTDPADVLKRFNEDDPAFRFYIVEAGEPDRLPMTAPGAYVNAGRHGFRSITEIRSF
jgi:hypothetical protein